MVRPKRFYNHNYTELSKSCKIFDMASVHHYNNLNFTNDNINNRIDCPGFLEHFKIRENPYNIRLYRPFIEKTQRRDYTFHAPIHRLR